MKNLKSFFLFTCILIIVSLSLTGCGTDNKPADIPIDTATDVVTETEVQIDYTKEAEKTLLTLAKAQTEDELKSVITEDSFDTANDILSAFPDDNYAVTAQLLGTYNDYDVYNFEITNKDTNESTSGCGLFKKENDGYLFNNNKNVLDLFVQSCQCSTCGGNGMIHTGGTACAICGGTGQMYNPNLHHDPNTNSFYGGMSACSGCGGIGYTGSNTNVCTACQGACFILN